MLDAGGKEQTVSALLGFEDQWKEDSKQINKGVYHYKLWYSEEKKG